MSRSFWGNAVDVVGGVGAIWYGLAEGAVRSVVKGERFLDAAQEGMGRVYDRVLDAADYADKHKDKINDAARGVATRAVGTIVGGSVGEVLSRHKH